MQRPAGLWRILVVMSFGALSLVAVGGAVYLSAVPTGYFFYRPEDAASFTPDLRTMALAFLLPSVEAGLALVVVRPWSFRASWGRLLAALGVFVPWLGFCGATVGPHIPMFIMLNVVWVALIVFLLTCALVVTVAVVLVRHRRQVSLQGPNSESVV